MPPSGDGDGERTPPPHGHPSVEDLDQVPLELLFGPPSGDGDGENTPPPRPGLRVRPFGEVQVFDVQGPLPQPSADALPEPATVDAAPAIPLANNGEMLWV